MMRTWISRVGSGICGSVTPLAYTPVMMCVRYCSNGSTGEGQKYKKKQQKRLKIDNNNINLVSPSEQPVIFMKLKEEIEKLKRENEKMRNAAKHTPVRNSNLEEESTDVRPSYSGGSASALSHRLE
eukprot:Tbor_TRINITY_DN6210_c1_g3::TRINITY_DN6210_c1_g3_i2::g.1871::m.1871